MSSFTENADVREEFMRQEGVLSQTRRASDKEKQRQDRELEEIKGRVEDLQGQYVLCCGSSVMCIT